CFEDTNIVHVEGRIDPVGDVATIDTELGLKDLETLEKRIQRAQKALKGPEAKTEKPIHDLCVRVMKGLNDGVPVRAQGLTAEEEPLIRDMHLLTSKKVFYVANVAEPELQDALAGKNKFVEALRGHANKEHAPVVVLSAQIEAEISAMDKADQPEFLASVGL